MVKVLYGPLWGVNTISKLANSTGAKGWNSELASQNSPFATAFIRFHDLAKFHVRFIYKPNAHLSN